MSQEESVRQEPAAVKRRDKKQDGRLQRKVYEQELRRLQAELCILQEWVKATGLRVMVVFEGRDAAGKGGTIRAITERVSPRVFRVAALPAPSDREKSQMYLQRYMAHFPAAGEIVIFDRSWYNRAGVEYVMGFCSKKEVSDEEQKRRFDARVDDPLRQWKLSPMDLPSRERWYEYSRARDRMLEATDTDYAPWHIVRSDDKRRARLNCIAHLLAEIPHQTLPHEPVKLPSRSKKDAYDDQATLEGRRFVPERY